MKKMLSIMGIITRFQVTKSRNIYPKTVLWLAQVDVSKLYILTDLDEFTIICLLTQWSYKGKEMSQKYYYIYMYPRMNYLCSKPTNWKTYLNVYSFQNIPQTSSSQQWLVLRSVTLRFLANLWSDKIKQKFYICFASFMRVVLKTAFIQIST